MTETSHPLPGRLPDDVSVELERVVRRWQQLPLDHALAASGAVRALAQDLADEAAAAAGRSPSPLPDLGPATALHQLQVTVRDLCLAASAATGAGDGDQAVERAAGIRPVAQRLADLRRALP